MEFLPNLFLLGTAKSASTSLHAALAAHPSICMSKPKEPFFFECEYEKGIAFYRDTYFSHWNGEPVIGDARHRNLYLPYVPRRIFEFNPEARLMVILRNPIDRAHSHWWHWRNNRLEALDFAPALEADLERIQKGLVVGTTDEMEAYCAAILGPGNQGYGLYRTYLDSGHYAEQLERYLELFPRDRLTVVLFEDFVNDPRGTCARVFRDLGVDPAVADELDDAKLNRTRPPRPQPAWRRTLRALPMRRRVPRAVRRLVPRVKERSVTMSRRDRAWLREYYSDHNRRLESLIQVDLTRWT